MLPVFTPLAKTSASSRTHNLVWLWPHRAAGVATASAWLVVGCCHPKTNLDQGNVFWKWWKSLRKFWKWTFKKMVRVMKVDDNQGIYNSFALNIGETPWEFHSKIRYCPPRRSSVGPSLGMLCGSDKKPSTKIPSWNFVGKNLRFLSVEIGTWAVWVGLLFLSAKYEKTCAMHWSCGHVAMSSH